jgi:hypothetical protein
MISLLVSLPLLTHLDMISLSGYGEQFLGSNSNCCPLYYVLGSAAKQIQNNTIPVTYQVIYGMNKRHLFTENVGVKMPESTA